jgi:membrane protein implicated in regulation of membrane protease activity
MNFRFSKLGTKCCFAYLALFIVALIFAKLTIEDSPLASIYIVALTFPWSYVITILLFVLDLIDSISTNVKLMMFVFYAIINATIIYYLFYKYEKRRNKQGAKSGPPINK